MDTAVACEIDILLIAFEPLAAINNNQSFYCFFCFVYLYFEFKLSSMSNITQLIDCPKAHFIQHSWCVINLDCTAVCVCDQNNAHAKPQIFFLNFLKDLQLQSL